MKIFFHLWWLVAASFPLWAGASELAERLKSDAYVLLMRHAYAPGVGDPAGYSLARCDSQRQLNDTGQAQAKKTGQWLRQQGVQEAKVFTSVWCRCQRTAELLQLGQPEVAPALASFFDSPNQAGAHNEMLQALIAKELQNKRQEKSQKNNNSGQKALILVTHHVNILGFVGQNIGSGDMVLARVDAQGRYLSHRLYPSP